MPLESNIVQENKSQGNSVTSDSKQESLDKTNTQCMLPISKNCNEEIAVSRSTDQQSKTNTPQDSSSEENDKSNLIKSLATNSTAISKLKCSIIQISSADAGNPKLPTSTSCLKTISTTVVYSTSRSNSPVSTGLSTNTIANRDSTVTTVVSSSTNYNTTTSTCLSTSSGTPCSTRTSTIVSPTTSTCFSTSRIQPSTTISTSMVSSSTSCSTLISTCSSTNTTQSSTISTDAGYSATSCNPPTKCSSTSTTAPPRSRSRRKLPNRPGIIWKVGSKIEAKDFMQKW